MPNCWFFATDLHGGEERYEKLLAAIVRERPSVVLLGGDLLPRLLSSTFISDFLAPSFSRIRGNLGAAYPDVLMILGNDDPRCEEQHIRRGESEGLWQYIHEKRIVSGGFSVYGYACVPPTPFLLKDWERYDVSRYVDPGCISPEEGNRTVPVSGHDIKWGTIREDLERLTGDAGLERSIFLFHVPPYETPLDRAALDGKMYEHVPLDVHIGSIAVRRFIERRQPLMTLHGHVHESARLTGKWSVRIGRTLCINAAHDGPELALVRFDPNRPDGAARELL